MARPKIAQTLLITLIALGIACLLLTRPIRKSRAVELDLLPQTDDGTLSSAPRPVSPSTQANQVNVPEEPKLHEKIYPNLGTSHSEELIEPAEVDRVLVQRYVQSILNPAESSFEIMECPSEIGARYEKLKTSPDNKTRYLIALDLYEVEKILPRLMSSIIQAIQYLGPHNCVISIVEGRSDDLTVPILKGVKTQLEAAGTRVHLVQDSVDPHGEGIDRIAALAELRNLAISPLVDHPSDFSSSAKVVFINDIAVCAEDVLELIYQHDYQGASMTCGMDWISNGDLFYDIWVSRTINSGNLFFEVPQDADWKYSGNLFWDDPPTKQKFDNLQPFEVYACWGGLVVLDSKPFSKREIVFRGNGVGECWMGEPTLLGKDLWKLGIGHIATVPTVNVGYSNDEGGKIKQRRGYVSTNIDTTLPPEQSQTELISWSSRPPGMVKCIGIFWNDPTWVSPI